MDKTEANWKLSLSERLDASYASSFFSPATRIGWFPGGEGGAFSEAETDDRAVSVQMRPIDMEKILSTADKEETARRIAVFYDLTRKYKRHADGKHLIETFVHPLAESTRFRKVSPEHLKHVEGVVRQSYDK